MDPITALSLSANILEFLRFGKGLLSSSREIYTSGTGFSERISHAEGNGQSLSEIAESLGTFAASLQAPPSHQSRRSHYFPPSWTGHITSLNNLISSCATDCASLLEAIRKLESAHRQGSRPGRWHCFKAALKESWHRDRILELEKSVSESQQTLTLLMSVLSSEGMVHTCSLIRDLREGQRIMHEERREQVRCLANRIQSLRAQLEQNRGSSHAGQANDSASMRDIADQLSRLSLTKDNLSAENWVLQRLDYDRRLARHEAIATPHEQTFRWIFDEQDGRSGQNGLGLSTASVPNEQGGQTFSSWLKSGQGLFWVTGKPGSGKSTLMKFIVGNPNTRRFLLQWSATGIVLASHYFWYAGTELQTSEEGLYRSILLDILSFAPDLIHELFGRGVNHLLPSTRESGGSLQRPDAVDHLQGPWTVSYLKDLVRKLPQLSKPQKKFCIFIDGLDEYKGNHRDMYDTIVELSNCSHIKLCVASRPWNVFQQTLGANGTPRLEMQNLTKHDIYRFSLSTLQKHCRWQTTCAQYSNGSDLIDQIVCKASGVFLWVAIAARQLQELLTDGSSYHMLLEQLDQYPPDLSDFFRRILDTVDQVHHPIMAESLKLASTSAYPIHLVLYSFLDAERADPLFAENLAVAPWPDGQIKNCIETMSLRLNGYCKGLLEVGRNGLVVEFLHRTVFDFLQLEEIVEFLDRKVRVGFRPLLFLLRAELAYFKVREWPCDISCLSESDDWYPEKFAWGTEAESIVEKASKIEAEEEEGSVRAAHSVLDDLERAICEILCPIPAFAGSNDQSTSLGRQTQPSDLALRLGMIAHRGVLLSSGLEEYIRRKCASCDDYFSVLTGSPLFLIIEACCGSSNRGSRVERTLRVLLETGHDPNEQRPRLHQSTTPVFSRTPWTQFLSIAMGNYPDRRGSLHFLSALQLDLIPLFLAHGAKAELVLPPQTNIVRRQDRTTGRIHWPLWLVMTDIGLGNQSIHLYQLHDKFLAALCCILDKIGPLFESIPTVDRILVSAGEPIEPDSCPTWDMFCAKLSEVPTWHRTGGNVLSRARFGVAIVKAIIQHSREEPVPWSEVVGICRSKFPALMMTEIESAVRGESLGKKREFHEICDGESASQPRRHQVNPKEESL